jgi:hypothetical protein
LSAPAISLLQTYKEVKRKTRESPSQEGEQIMTEKNRINDRELEHINGGTETEVPACIEQYSEKIEKKMEKDLPNLCKLIKYLFGE